MPLGLEPSAYSPITAMPFLETAYPEPTGIEWDHETEMNVTWSNDTALDITHEAGVEDK